MIRIADTHSLLWFLENDRRLTAKARGAMADLTGRLVVPTIVAGEIWHLCQRRRVTSIFEDLLGKWSRIRNIEFAPLDVALFPLLPAGFELHDAIIIATARSFSALTKEPVAIVTKDADISEKSGVEIIW
ncbi:MAG: hypothetical protein A3G34_10970 [Candidatus Lindowbacteria bacterium RIFCSPLOWO2_12_FULL_62_27]|nr:MAG: hypothetical protein A3I06_12035 [Candidatus Lindowbacteria bacterium RIFCSPLOWO2_02_FULL_62_12]OGH60640.1 MAG: hypothetical protein A3G34_10970 [Candidatus Lindowbacteria bacterium RIFCSPLOWO2_12_FULL_62_27]